MKVKRKVIKGRLVKGWEGGQQITRKFVPGETVELAGPMAAVLDDLGITEPLRKPKPETVDTPEDAGGEE